MTHFPFSLVSQLVGEPKVSHSGLSSYQAS
jgi:hypothetical protein